MAKKGIDVSVWQGDIDFSKVKASGIDFVIIRAGYGIGNKDRWFEENYRKAKAEGLSIGAYWYSYANSKSEAVEEARTCKSVLTGKQFDYPIYFDLEEKSQLARGRTFCDALISSFCNEMENGAYYAGFYTSLSVANNLVSESICNRYALWLAQWNNSCSYKGNYGLWQYSSRGQVRGISGNVDMNYAYIDYPSIIKQGGFNGYGKQVTNTKQNNKSIDDIAREVIEGQFGNGDKRKRNLEKAGYDYKVVQSKVNKILGTERKSVDELAIEVIRGVWGNGETRKARLTQAGYDYQAVQKRVNEML